MPKVKEAHLEARRQQVLDAASECFARKGFHQSTMQDICQQADLSMGAVYRYFDSKEEIIRAMVDARRAEAVALIETAARERQETLAVLDELVDIFFSKLEDVEGCAVDIDLWAEASSSPQVKEILQSIFRDIGQAFEQIMRRAQERGEVNPALDPRAIAQVMISFFDGLVLQKTIDPSVDVRRYVTAMRAMMCGLFWQGGSDRPKGVVGDVGIGYR